MMIDYKCVTCGHIFQDYASENRRCCSKECADRRATNPSKTCPTCGMLFHGPSHRQFCSLGCRRKTNLSRATKPCPTCQKPISSTPSQVAARRFCSRACRPSAVKPERVKTPRVSKLPEYRAFHEAKRRCTDPKRKEYADYGGRGIEFRFYSFTEFFTEVGQKPTAQHSLDRKDNDGHYEKGNVRWATPKEQMNNRRPRSKRFKK